MSLEISASESGEKYVNEFMCVLNEHISAVIKIVIYILAQLFHVDHYFILITV